jgi:hypothetical protein
MTYVAVSVLPDKGDRPRVTLGPSGIAALYLVGGYDGQSMHVQFDTGGPSAKATEAAEYFEALAKAATEAMTWCRAAAGA